jgi:hypothetical protein
MVTRRSCKKKTDVQTANNITEASCQGIGLTTKKMRPAGTSDNMSQTETYGDKVEKQKPTAKQPKTKGCTKTVS